MKKKSILNQNGQAMIEFILFLPFMLMMYSVLLSLSNSINASINQQKITRGYFYYRLQNNSMFPRPRRVGAEAAAGWNSFGMQIMGWAERLEGGITPVAPCYKFQLPIGTSEDDSCNDGYSGEMTQFVRVATVYGVCGATYVKESGYNILTPMVSSVSSPITPTSNIACLLQ